MVGERLENSLAGAGERSTIGGAARPLNHHASDENQQFVELARRVESRH